MSVVAAFILFVLGFIFALPLVFGRHYDRRHIRAEINRNTLSCRLEKAECLKIKSKIVSSYIDSKDERMLYEGTFVTRDGVQYETGGKTCLSDANENNMMAVLFSTKLRPLSDPRTAECCATPEGIRLEFQSLLDQAVRIRAVNETRTHPASSDFDCLLFLGGVGGGTDSQNARVVRTHNIKPAPRFSFKKRPFPTGTNRRNVFGLQLPV